MFGEILIALVIMWLIVYGFYQWLEWGKKYQENLLIWKSVPYALGDDLAYMDTYGPYMPENYQIDTYKYLYFWITYFKTWMLFKF